jgi:A118 family predicted phage portal protein
MGLLQKIKDGFARMKADTQIGKEYKDVFELSGIPPFRQFYQFAIYPAKWVYRGLYKPWHIVPAPSIAHKDGTRTLFRMHMAKAACAEMAGLVWSEGADVTITQGEDDTLGRFVQSVLDENNFSTKMQEHIEQTAALGGGALKEYVKVKKDDNGNYIKGSERIVIDYCMADQFIPTSWDNAEVKEGVFISRIAKGGYYYTRLEWHRWNGDTYEIENQLYRSSMKNGANENQDILGFYYPLNDIYPDIEPIVDIKGLKTSLFSYYRTPTANNVDDNSPLGLSMYGNAYDTLQALDIAYDSLVREIRLGKKRIIVPVTAVKSVVDENGQMRRFFDENDEAYEALNIDDAEALKIQDNSLELRIKEHAESINAHLSTLCLQMGFSSATFSFDQQNGIKTATEVISENSKTYKTVKTFQTQVTTAIKKLCENIIALGALYDMEFEGKSIAQLAANDYEISVNMDDAVLEDSKSKLDKAVLLVTNGLLSKKTAMTDKRYGICMTEAEAEQELQEIAKESPINSLAVDRFNSFNE